MTIDARTRTWWNLLRGASVLNVVLLVLAVLVVPFEGPMRVAQAVCATIYVGVCGFRSFFPRVDLERIVLVDHPLSSIVLGRTAATIAEMAFTVQVALILDLLATNHQLGWAHGVALALVPLIALAQTACWLGVLTLNHLWHAVEELLWGLEMLLVAVVFLACLPSAQAASTTLLLLLGVLACLGAAWVMLVQDVPMYARRHRLAVMESTRFLSVSQGLRDAWTRREPTGSWEVWKHEVGWMTPYFTGGVWLSVLMILI